MCILQKNAVLNIKNSARETHIKPAEYVLYIRGRKIRQMRPELHYIHKCRLCSRYDRSISERQRA